ncbi:adenosylcobinamide-phosphate synthase CbiB [Marinobacterium sp. CAU 1594]|nr:adenosylcobinamide-phosphate synthase CbiB [Marinobacterium arenosum]
MLLPTLLLGVLLDRWLGEPRRWHWLVGFGRLAGWLESRLNRGGGRLIGVLTLLLAVLPLPVLLLWLHLQWAGQPWLQALLAAGCLYLALGGRSLVEHAEAVAVPLHRGDLAAARKRVGWIVSRETASMDERQVSIATVESVLENGNDALFAALFWCLIGGAPAVILFRLVNTLDAMWGYKTERYHRFGWAAARLDDLLGWLPARLTALSYALAGDTRTALRCWRDQAAACASPNGGPVMCAGAGALNAQLGGTVIYHGKAVEKPPMGSGRWADGAAIDGAIRLLRRSLVLWLVAVALFSLPWLSGGTL